VQMSTIGYVFGGLAVVVVVGVVTFAVVRAGALPSGPVDVVWDREACAYCRMHVGEPGFAAQVQLEDGRVWFYDDPGCLFLHLDSTEPHVHAIYFHHSAEDRWLTADQVAFRSVPRSPMGFGLAAVDRGGGDTLDFEEARRKVLASRHETGKDR